MRSKDEHYTYGTQALQDITRSHTKIPYTYNYPLLKLTLPLVSGS